MSNKLTRKGITFGTITAFALSALVGVAPANADQSLAITPIAGSTLESIRESGVFASASIADATEGFTFRITSQTSGYTTDQLYDDIRDGDVYLDAYYDAGSPVTSLHTAGAAVDASLDTFAEVSALANCSGDSLESTDFMSVNLEGTTVVVRFNEYNVAACKTDDDNDGDGSWNEGGDDTLFNFAAGSAVYLSIIAEDADPNQDLSLSVRSHDDVDQDSVIDDGEAISSISNVTLYDSGNVQATTTISRLVVGQAVQSKVTFNKPKLNTYFLTSFSPYHTVASAFYDSSSTSLADAYSYSLYAPIASTAWFTTENAKTDKSNKWNFPLTATASGTAAVGNYAARAFYNDDITPSSGDWVRWMGPRSVNEALVAGNSALVDGIYGFVTDTNNLVQLDDNEVAIRVGTKSATVTAQILDDSDEDLALSNARVKAVFTKIDLEDNDTVISFAGSTSTLNEEDDTVTLYARTDAKGQASFTFTSSDESEFDLIDVHFYALDETGVWDDSNGADQESQIGFQWQVGYVYDFEVNPSGPVSGSTITLTYTATDQFGVGISSTGTRARDALKVTLVGTDDEGGVLDLDVLEQTQGLVNGSASFTFTNYARENSFEWVAGILHYTNDEVEARNDAFYNIGTEGTSPYGSYISIGGYDYADSFEGSASVIDTQVFKNAATAEISAVDNEYSNVVTYQTFKAGNYTSDKAFKKAVDEYGLYSGATLADKGTKAYISGEFATIRGTVETVGGSGAVAQQVTITGSGLLFVKDRVDGYDEIHGIGSITVWTDVDGNFEVDVFSHKENLSGLNVSISSGGKSFGTKLFTYMNQDIDNNEYYDAVQGRIDGSVFKWNWKKVTGNAPSANTQYLITITAKDVWGNLLRNADIDVYPNGWAEVGGVRFDDIVDEDNYHGYTDANGKFTFTVEKGMWYWNLGEDTDEVAFLAAPSGNGGTIKADLSGFVYDLDGDGNTTDPNEFDTSSFTDELEGVDELTASFKFGPQATAAAGTKKGVVRVNAYNVKGKTVKVFVAGKLVKTVVSDKAKFLTKVKGVKAGTKRVTVVVGKKRMYTGFVTVK